MPKYPIPHACCQKRALTVGEVDCYALDLPHSEGNPQLGAFNDPQGIVEGWPAEEPRALLVGWCSRGMGGRIASLGSRAPNERFEHLSFESIVRYHDA